MRTKVWPLVIVLSILALAAGSITAQNLLGGDAEKQPAQEELETPITGEVRSAEGILIGRIDNHSVEIEMNGTPTAFGLSAALMEKNFAAGRISFKYVQQNGRMVITEANCQEAEEIAVLTAEGIFSGQADSHTVEIEIDGSATAFGLATGISFDTIEEGEPVFIAYQEETGGRPVIVKVERID
jgi:hypothetical protein